MAVGRGGGTDDRVVASPVGVKPGRCLGTGATEPLGPSGLVTAKTTQSAQSKMQFSELHM